MYKEADKIELSETDRELLVSRESMQELSDYFERDARRYDNGFERW